jgi:hypothetical protein
MEDMYCLRPKDFNNKYAVEMLLRRPAACVNQSMILPIGTTGHATTENLYQQWFYKLHETGTHLPIERQGE